MVAMLSDTSLLIIALVLLALFGGSQLPKLARNLGSAGKEFRKGQAESEAEAPATPVLPAAPAATSSDSITMSKAELNALLDEREARAKAAGTNN